jgi:hypothetical protein
MVFVKKKKKNIKRLLQESKRKQENIFHKLLVRFKIIKPDSVPERFLKWET